jgi:organic radical activating enzyme
MLQVDDGIVDALHAHAFQIAIESNGTIMVHPGIDWVCISPKAGSDVIQRTGDELKLVWPQPTSEVDAMEQWQFAYFLIQPMDTGDAGANAANVKEATRFVMERPKWRLSLQNHKILGLP